VDAGSMTALQAVVDEGPLHKTLRQYRCDIGIA
jgi:hypothetical protein